MARFYGTIQGARGPTSRLGHSNLNVTAQSYNGNIEIELWRGKDEQDNVRITARPHNGGAGLCLYQGDMAELLNTSLRKAKLMALGMDEFLKEFDQRPAE